jgi:hypothetical protein
MYKLILLHYYWLASKGWTRTSRAAHLANAINWKRTGRWICEDIA